MPLVLHTRVVTGHGGGPEKTILNSPRFLIPFGYDTLCAYLHPPQDPGFAVIEARAKQLAAPFVGIEDRGPLDCRVVRRFLEICRRKKVTIWHGHDYKSNALGLLICRFWPMRLVTTVHGWVKFTRRTPLYYWIDRLCLRFYERVICVSEDLYQDAIAHGVKPSRCTLIENAIDPYQYQRTLAIAEAKRRCGVSAERLLIGAVGRLSAEKDFPGLIQAAHQLLADGYDLELMIIGDGDQRGELESLISSLQRRERFHLLGYRSDMIDLYQAMDVFVLSSLREGLPNVLLEAMAMGIPVVATRIAGVPRLVEDGVNGLLVAPGNTAELASVLARILGSPDLRHCCADAARKTIEQSYSFERRMQKVRAVYDELLKGVDH